MTEKKYSNIFRMLAVILTILAAMLAAGCGEKKEEIAESETAEANIPETEALTYSASDSVIKTKSARVEYNEKHPDETWAVYMYVCGSNLEDDYGCLTDNLCEIDYSDFPENLKLVIQTGGAKEWWNESFDPEYLERWEVNTEDGLKLVEQLTLDNTADPYVLADFLEFCDDNYDADRKMLLFWDHGGGTVHGFGGDSNYPDDDAMDISEIEQAIEHAFGADEKDPPLDIIAFDCCLMSTVDVAERLKDEASYLLASEQVEPGDGYDYAALVDLIGDNSNITPKEYGMKLADAYFDKNYSDYRGNLTVALTDLSKIDKVTEAVDDFGEELLRRIYDDSEYFREIVVAALTCTNYGTNCRSIGYYNLIDAADFADCLNVQGGSRTGKALIKAVDEAVVYNVCDEVMKYSHGLSMFFPFDANLNDVIGFSEQGVNTAFKSIYEIDALETVGDEEKEYIDSLGLDGSKLPDILNYNEIGKYNDDVKKNKDGRYCVKFGDKAWSCTTNILENLYYFDDNGDMWYLGCDDEVLYDEDGVITDDFHGKWFYINGNPVTAELIYDSDERNVWVIPVEIMDESSNRDGSVNLENVYGLQLVYNAEDDSWSWLGILPMNSGPGESRIIQLEDHDRIRILRTFLGEEENEYRVIEEISYGELDWLYDYMPDGEYAMGFMTEDVQKNVLLSDFFYFKMNNGKLKY